MFENRNRLVTANFDEILDVFDRALGGFNYHLTRSYIDEIRYDAPIDYVQDKEIFEIRVEVPGVELSEVDVTVEKDILTIVIDQKKDNDNKKVRYQLKKQIYVPENVDVKGIKATLKSGILKVALPKKIEKKSESQKVKVVEE